MNSQDRSQRRDNLTTMWQISLIVVKRINYNVMCVILSLLLTHKCMHTHTQNSVRFMFRGISDPFNLSVTVRVQSRTYLNSYFCFSIKTEILWCDTPSACEADETVAWWVFWQWSQRRSVCRTLLFSKRISASESPRSSSSEIQSVLQQNQNNHGDNDQMWACGALTLMLACCGAHTNVSPSHYFLKK